MTNTPAFLTPTLWRHLQTALLALVLVLGGRASLAQGAATVLDTPTKTQRLTQLTEMGVRYEHSEGVERDFGKALAFYCAAAREGHPDAMIRLGWMFANSRGVPRDDAVAGTLFRKAAEMGSEIAGRLAELVRANEDKLPACMTDKRAQVALDLSLPVTPRTALVLTPPDTGPTPTLDNPAQFRSGPTSIERRKLVQLVTTQAREAKLDPRLVFAIIFAESNFDPLVRSPKGALGLMQLIPETAERFGVSDVWNPEQNIRGGIAYLKWLLSYFRGDVLLAIAGYNAGEGAVDKFRGIPPFSETMAYVQKIRALYPRDYHAFEPRLAMRSAAVPR